MSTRLLSPTVDRQEIESLSETSLQVLLVRVQGVITIQIYQDDEEKTAFPTQVKSLNGKVTGLNRFLSNSADKSLPCSNTQEVYEEGRDFVGLQKAGRSFHAAQAAI
ncbi:hypothetical protein Tco_0327988 [Tanacetum coccineum]